MSSASPDTALATAALALAQQHETPSVLNHSIRTHRFALRHAELLGLKADADFDAELLFVACVLHDIGAFDAFDGPQRFEVEGADAAAALLRDHGRSDADIDLVWQGIALHTSPGIAERRGTLPLLTRVGIRTDFFSVRIPDAERAVIERELPRLGLDHEISALVVAQALRQPEKARASSWPADLLREHYATQGGPLAPTAESMARP
ncbi:MAG TPA: HD domain-containing protein [Pseudolysinimonas sp.]|jgi:hypothetical protein